MLERALCLGCIRPAFPDVYILRALCIHHVLYTLRDPCKCRGPYSLCDLCIRHSQHDLGIGDLAGLFLCSRDILYDLGDDHNPAYTRDQNDSCGMSNSYLV